MSQRDSHTLILVLLSASYLGCGPGPQETSADFTRGVEALEAQDYSLATACFDKVLQRNPNHAAAYQNRAIARAAIGEREKAIADFTRAIALEPDNPGAFFNRAKVHAEMGMNALALADYTKAIRLQPSNAKAHASRGTVHSELQDYDRAIADLTMAIKLDATLPKAHFNRGMAFHETGDFARAIADYTEAIRLNSRYAKAYMSRGISQAERKDFGKAIADFTTAIRLDPTYAMAYHNRAIVYAANGDVDLANRDYEKAASLDPPFLEGRRSVALNSVIKEFRFPTGVGTRWQYAISLGTVDPLQYEERIWPVLNEAKPQPVRGRFPAMGTATQEDNFTLSFRIVAVDDDSQEHGVSRLRLEIENDDFGVFTDAKDVYWLVQTPPSGPTSFEVDQIMTYSSARPDVPAQFGFGGSLNRAFVEDGANRRTVFMLVEPGTKDGIWTQNFAESMERFKFVGVTHDAPEHKGIPILHFQRVVAPCEEMEGRSGDPASAYLRKGFTEDMWYKSGTGLVRLEQKVDGELSMTWKLVDMQSP